MDVLFLSGKFTNFYRIVQFQFYQLVKLEGEGIEVFSRMDRKKQHFFDYLWLLCISAD